MSDTESLPGSCFVDTNVWLYAFISGPEGDKSELARQLLRGNEGALVVSSQVINEVCVNLLEKAHLSEAEIQELIRSFYAKYPVVLLDEVVQLSASELRGRYSLSFWDSLILAAALHSGATVLYSEDFQAGLQVDGRLLVRNPFRR